MCEGGARVKFCQTKMETQSCKYGFILLVHLWQFHVGEGNFYLEMIFRKVVHCVVHNRL